MKIFIRKGKHAKLEDLTEFTALEQAVIKEASDILAKNKDYLELFEKDTERAVVWQLAVSLKIACDWADNLERSAWRKENAKKQKS